MRATDVVFSIARKELSDRLRNRWVWTVSAVLFMSTFAIAAFGAAPVGVVGVQKAGAALASMMNLTVYLVPLLALILGCGALIDEKERGTLDLILVYPLSSAEFFIGTFAGFAAALTTALLIGFAGAGIVLGLWVGVDMMEFLALVFLSLVLGVVFLALSFLLSILSGDRARAVASSVFVWIGAVFVFDLALIGLLIYSDGEISTDLFGALMLVNPADVFRILCFKWMESAATPQGLTAAIPPGFTTPLLVGTLVIWAVVPLFLTHILFQRRVANDSLV